MNKAPGGIFPDPLFPGFKNILLKPNFVNGLNSFKASPTGPFGEIISSWKRYKKEIFYDVTVLTNSTTNFFVLSNVKIKEEKNKRTAYLTPDIVQLESGTHRMVLMLKIVNPVNWRYKKISILMKYSRMLILLSAIVILSCGSKQVSKQPTPPSPPSVTKSGYRGFNITAAATEQDIKDLKAMNANLVRIQFGYRKLISKTAPYAYNADEFNNLDRILSLCEQYKIRAVIDPHTVPGMQNDYTGYPDDAIWTSAEFQEILANLWKKISDRYKTKGSVIYGYDLLNEPFNENNINVWNSIVARLTKLIRDNGDKHPIIIEAAGYRAPGVWVDRHQNLAALKLPAYDSLIVSFHFYEPFKYTHQLDPDKAVVTYLAAGGKAAVESAIQSSVNYQKANPGIKIYVGEFSVSRLPTDGDEFVKDVIDIFEANKWDWTYHSFREYAGWDPEMALGSLTSTTRNSSSPRMNLLKSYFTKNQ